MSCRTNDLDACESKIGPVRMGNDLKIHHNFMKGAYREYLDLIDDSAIFDGGQPDWH